MHAITTSDADRRATRSRVGARMPGVRRLLAPLVATALLLSGCATTAPGDDEVAAVSSKFTIDVDGVSRDYFVRAPEHESSEALPVVMFLHGLGSGAEEMESWVDATDRIEEDRFIAVYPEGLLAPDDSTRTWNAGNCCNPIGAERTDDIGFLSAVIDTLPEYGGDTDRVFVTGFSNGGMLAYRAACDLGSAIAGIAAVSTAYNVSDCTSTDQMPVVIVHGTADDLIPYEGSNGDVVEIDGIEPHSHQSVVFAVDTWVKRDGCDEDVTTETVGSAEHVTFTGCDAGSSVDLYTVDGSAHVWPNEDDNGFSTTDVALSTFLGE